MQDLPSYLQNKLQNSLKDKTLFDKFMKDLYSLNGDKKRFMDFKEKVLASGEIEFLVLLEENEII